LLGISRRFGGLRVLDAISLEVRAGEHVGLVGPNGAGKTTLLRILAGTVLPDAGRALIGGHTAGTLDARRRTGVGFSFEGSFFEALTAAQNLQLFARLRLGRREAQHAVRAVVEELELGWFAQREVAGFSAGMRGQLALARALLGEPDVLLLDEPTRSLDAGATERLWQAVERRSHVAVLLASHRREDLDRCSRSLVLGDA
jgi:ABC-type multidrug transport system ATPase subunit